MAFKKKTEEKLGDILLRDGTITNQQLDQAVMTQRIEKGLLGEILIKLGYVNETQIAQAIMSQYDFPYIPLENYEFNPEASALIPENVARQYRVVPLDLIGDILTISMSDPLNKSAIEDVEMLTQKKVHVFLSVITAVNEALNRVYTKKK